MNNKNKDFDILFGKTKKHLQLIGENLYVHSEIITPFNELVNLGKKNGFNIKIASGFRSYDRQLEIWEQKVNGRKPILDDFENEININDLTKNELLFKILRWSAIPGASRHHWGTDIDIYETTCLPEGYSISLTNKEVCLGGILFDFHEWLGELIDSNKSFNFIRPYKQDFGGVHPEKWHLSYSPISEDLTQAFSYDTFLELMKKNIISLHDEILKNSELIYQKYINLIKT